MGQRRYPPLTPNQIIQILLARGFIEDHRKGDHRYFLKIVDDKKFLPQVDMGNPAYDENLLPLLIKETGLNREEFYGSTKNTAKKINVKVMDLGKLP